ncbi:hypothetical protein N657DRAFT_162448 [Parathielavia appendiculata]|uniref:Uncharacterized protein n=1 Tax=Parathielavia appendiculata TaxID=2587402 RepID=A0AAN6YZT8_9PEZI|nr:hypothetical protein N657DRAFT_162448 [Parathielavia appendiculata]
MFPFSSETLLKIVSEDPANGDDVTDTPIAELGRSSSRLRPLPADLPITRYRQSRLSTCVRAESANRTRGLKIARIVRQGRSCALRMSLPWMSLVAGFRCSTASAAWLQFLLRLDVGTLEHNRRFSGLRDQRLALVRLRRPSRFCYGPLG